MEQTKIKKVLVTGGIGYIGSHTVIELIEADYEVIIIDNLVNSSLVCLERVKAIVSKPENITFEEVDLRDATRLSQVFHEYLPDAVIHFAALKAVGESVAKPLDYYENNVGGTINLLKSMNLYKCNMIVFSSSACVYGDNPYASETDRLAPINPYGMTKVMCEQIIQDYSNTNKNFAAVILRYFNPIGAHSSGMIGEDPKDIPNNLMPYLQKVASGQLPHLNVFGKDYDTVDGTGVRDYIHVVDLAQGHIVALDKQEQLQGYHVFNLGTGNGTSVLQLATAFEKAFETEMKKVMCDRRPGDAPKSTACADKVFNELGWKAKLDIDDMCRDSANWTKKNPNGFHAQP
ncbi:udp-glucose 4-epimerase [Stylonychia lemnae]|uniref:UDP-glucose 4-epimerase n=1 Tax=Stylonychia lemnae TaxID=5949 RepID=A0A078A055_STYLE|nr:udp-glucose 4-epimerase [Stylonychia lemnae]|eukprot:CDW75571.1 udp-glucose 4-epimerase [Stylonychia lemnae]